MTIRELIAELHDELALLEQVINSLERLSPAEMLGSIHPPAAGGRAYLTSHRSRGGQSGSMNATGLYPPQDRLWRPGAALRANLDEGSL
jgi:hypothetical protein